MNSVEKHWLERFAVSQLGDADQATVFNRSLVREGYDVELLFQLIAAYNELSDYERVMTFRISPSRTLTIERAPLSGALAATRLGSGRRAGQPE